MAAIPMIGALAAPAAAADEHDVILAAGDRMQATPIAAAIDTRAGVDRRSMTGIGRVAVREEAG